MDTAVVSIIATSTIAIASLAVGLFTTKINNKHQLKMKKSELLNNEKIIAFKEYVTVLNKFVYISIKAETKMLEFDDLVEWHEEYFKKLSAITLFANKKSKEKISDFGEIIDIFFKEVEEVDVDFKTLDEFQISITKYLAIMQTYENTIFDLIEVLSEEINDLES